jgi:hypothetical protein
MKYLLWAMLFLPAMTSAQTLVARNSDGTTWLLYADTVKVGDRQQDGDRLVSVLVEQRDARGQTVHRAHQYTSGCYVDADGRTRWGDGGSPDEWTWSGPLILDAIATRSCQHAWNLVEPDAGVATTERAIPDGQRTL